MNIIRSMVRIVNASIASVFVLLVILLAMVTPATSGLGTHEQIIPIPCLFKEALGVPCPSCGLTTSLSRLIHGDIAGSFRAHPLGPLFGVLFLVIIAASMAGLLQKRAWWNVLQKRWFQNALLYGIAIYLTTWIIRLII